VLASVCFDPDWFLNQSRIFRLYQTWRRLANLYKRLGKKRGILANEPVLNLYSRKNPRLIEEPVGIKQTDANTQYRCLRVVL